jgi:hypothetical protein
MATKSIGSLFIDIEARTAKLETDMAKVRGIVTSTNTVIGKESSDAWSKSRSAGEQNLIQLTQRLAGALALFTFMKSEILHVAANIDKIQGIPAMTVASVQTMNSNLAAARQTLDGWIAGGLSLLSQSMEAIGLTIGAASAEFFDFDKAMVLMNDATKLTVTNLDDVARQSDITYDDKVRARVSALAEAKKESARASLSEAQQIVVLRNETQAYELFAKSNSFNTLVRTEAQIEGLRKLGLANTKLQNQQTNLKQAEVELTKSLGEAERVSLSGRERVLALMEKQSRLQGELSQLRIKDPKQQDPLSNEKRLEVTKELTSTNNNLNRALEKQGEMYRDIGNSVAAGFGEAILSGEKLSTVLNKLLGDLLRIILQRAILSPLADMFTGGLKSMFSPVPAKAAGGPMNGLTLVGERGPELVSGIGTVYPNEKISGMLGGTAGNTYNIDARGADTGAVMRIENALLHLAGPGVVERRALTASVNAQQRRSPVGARY